MVPAEFISHNLSSGTGTDDANRKFRQKEDPGNAMFPGQISFLDLIF